MKVAILAGGVGSRLAEQTDVRPKPMVEIGGRPILWHIMKHYRHYGHTDFAVALGYKGEQVKQWFADYHVVSRDLSVDLRQGTVTVHRDGVEAEDWRVDLVDTGETTNTGGRIKRLAPWLGDKTFMLTWGDGVADVDLGALLAFHRAHGRLATVTAVRPPARFGKLDLDDDVVTRFSEKPQLEEGWINGAFFVLEPRALQYIDGDNTQWEREPLEGLAKDGQLRAYRHHGFWQCMDTLRDRNLLEQLWAQPQPPWKTWQ